MIVITTPTGRVGGQVLDNALDGGSPVRVVARDPSRLPARVRGRVEVVRGSHGDPAVVDEAFAGADTVFWLVPPDPGAGNVLDYYRDFTRPACEAVTRRGVDRFVAITSAGRNYPRNAGLLSAAFAMEGLIEQAGVAYRGLGMPFFMENLLGQVGSIAGGGTFTMANAADRPLATVATRDIANVAAGLLLDDSWDGQEDVPVFGPDASTPDDMARVVSEVLERPVRYEQAGYGDFKETMMGHGMGGSWAQGMVDMVAAQNDGIYDAEQRTARPCPTGFRGWCEDTLRPAVAT